MAGPTRVGPVASPHHGAPPVARPKVVGGQPTTTKPPYTQAPGARPRWAAADHAADGRPAGSRRAERVAPVHRLAVGTECDRRSEGGRLALQGRDDHLGEVEREAVGLPDVRPTPSGHGERPGGEEHLRRARGDDDLSEGAYGSPGPGRPGRPRWTRDATRAGGPGGSAPVPADRELVVLAVAGRRHDPESPVALAVAALDHVAAAHAGGDADPGGQGEHAHHDQRPLHGPSADGELHGRGPPRRQATEPMPSAVRRGELFAIGGACRPRAGSRQKCHGDSRGTARRA